MNITSHIQGLFLILFLKYLPFALNQGKVYCAIPPLYGINVGKGKMKFFADNIEYVEYVQNIYCKDHEIYNIKKKKLTKTEIVRLLYNNIDYLKHLLHVANTYAIDPEFLEFLLYHRKLEFKKFKAEVEKAYRFTKVTKENGIIIIHGLVGALYQTVFFNDRLLNECKEVIKLIERSDEYYIINNQKTTLYGLMKGFSDYEPTGLTRYKGLGEMPPKLLGESTVIPGMGRTLRQYTVDDVKKELKYVTSLQSDKSVFVEGIKVRREDIV